MRPNTQHVGAQGRAAPGGGGAGSRACGARQCWAQGLLCGRRWAQCHFQTARGDDSRVYSPPRACRAPTPLPALRLPERGQQGPALWDGGTRASAGLVEALGSPRALV